MNKKEKIEKLASKKYTVKQAIAYYVISYIDTENKLNLRELISNLMNKIIRIDEKKILEMREAKIIEKTKYQWILTADQVLSYGYIIFNNLAMARQTIRPKDITKEFESVVKLYSPNNAEEFLEKELTIDKKFNE